MVLTMLSQRVILKSLRGMKQITHSRALCIFHNNATNNIFKSDCSNNNSLLKHNPNNLCATVKRFKSKKKTAKKTEEIESEDEEDIDDEDSPHDKNVKIMETTTASLRIDLVIKAALGIPRNKVETAFYDSKIRKNGQRVLKKSDLVEIDDEIHLIAGKSTDNPDFLIVSQITLLEAKPSLHEQFKIKIAKQTNLLIENYEDPWNPSA